jgi:hypothetical protein
VPNSSAPVLFQRRQRREHDLADDLQAPLGDVLEGVSGGVPLGVVVEVDQVDGTNVVVEERDVIVGDRVLVLEEIALVPTGRSRRPEDAVETPVRVGLVVDLQVHSSDHVEQHQPADARAAPQVKELLLVAAHEPARTEQGPLQIPRERDALFAVEEHQLDGGDVLAVPELFRQGQHQADAAAGVVGADEMEVVEGVAMAGAALGVVVAGEDQPVLALAGKRHPDVLEGELLDGVQPAVPLGREVELLELLFDVGDRAVPARGARVARAHRHQPGDVVVGPLPHVLGCSGGLYLVGWRTLLVPAAGHHRGGGEHRQQEGTQARRTHHFGL